MWIGGLTALGGRTEKLAIDQQAVDGDVANP